MPGIIIGLLFGSISAFTIFPLIQAHSSNYPIIIITILVNFRDERRISKTKVG